METPYQPRTPIRAKLNKVTEKLVLQEVNEMLEKGAIRETIHCKAQFVSHLFLVSKKDGGEQPVINLKDLNTFIPYKHFKVEGLHILKEILFWTLSSPKVVHKTNKSTSLHPSQIVYKNTSIPRRFSNTRENFRGNNLKQGYCDLRVTESRICYKI